MTPQIARERNSSAIDGRTNRPTGYAMSILVRRGIESIFSGMKTVEGMRKTRFRGLGQLGLQFPQAATACNRVRMARLGVDRLDSCARNPSEGSKKPGRTLKQMRACLFPGIL